MQMICCQWKSWRKYFFFWKYLPQERKNTTNPLFTLSSEHRFDPCSEISWTPTPLIRNQWIPVRTGHLTLLQLLSLPKEPMAKHRNFLFVRLNPSVLRSELQSCYLWPRSRAQKLNHLFRMLPQVPFSFVYSKTYLCMYVCFSLLYQEEMQDFRLIFLHCLSFYK